MPAKKSGEEQRYAGGKPGRRQPSELLRAMRLVSAQEEEEDAGPLQRHCRQVLKENPKEFLAQLARMEAGMKPGGGPTDSVRIEEPVPARDSPGPSPSSADDGEVRVRELLTRLLNRIEGQ